MRPLKIAKAVKFGEDVLENSAEQDRCDFSILLRDKWRHKALVRDVPIDTEELKSETLRIEGQLYDSLKQKILLPNELSRTALITASMHWILSAYVQENDVVIGVVKKNGRDNSLSNKLFPAVFSKKDSLKLSCRSVVKVVENVLNYGLNSIEVNNWVGKGLFDLIVFESDSVEYDKALPLSITIDETESGLSYRWNYSSRLFEDRVIRGLIDIAQEVFQQLSDKSDITLRELELVSATQVKQFDHWNATEGEFSAVRLEQLFESAAIRTPEKLAIICNNTRLNFKQLNYLANELSKWFLSIAMPTKSNKIVALCLDKSHLTVSMILALWKAGASFVAIDPNYPKERISFIIEDVDAHCIITNKRHLNLLKGIKEIEKISPEIFALEEAFESLSSSIKCFHADLPSPFKNDSTAYVTYTSGTTGTPKGVSKAHEMVVNSITDISARYKMTGDNNERVALFSSLVFEPFLRQMLIALINSKTLVIVPDKLRLDPVRFSEFIKTNEITYLNGTLSLLQQFDFSDSDSLKRLILVGEELTPSGLKKLRETYHGKVINEYAFTETAFVTAVKVFDPGCSERPNRSIGRPLRNIKCYVLDQNLKRVPIGAIGVLFIGGSGVAKRYLNREDLTRESFFKNPYQTENEKQYGINSRIYSTGDLARFLPNGEIEFLGRSDFQVKLNGIRVEPGEIESKILDYPNIKQCVVVPEQEEGADRTWRLVGYFVSANGELVNEKELIKYLEKRLITVMVPTRLVQLSRFILNINGKVDRACLPRIQSKENSESSTDVNIEISSDELAETIVKIWSGLLSIPPREIGYDDDFINLGGQSITCIQLLAKLWKEKHVHITLDDLYQLRTIRNLSTHIRTKLNSEESAATFAAENKSHLRANGLQQGLMYQALRKLDSVGTYTMQTLCNYKCILDEDTLREAWLIAKEKYPSLRLRFEWDAEPLQIIEPNSSKLNWQCFDWTNIQCPIKLSEKLNDLKNKDRNNKYVLSKGDLIRIYLIKFGNTEYTLLLSCHHIILDGWSIRILLDKVHQIYADLKEGRAVREQFDSTYVDAQLYIANNRDKYVDYWTDEINKIDELGDYSGLLNDESRYRVKLDSYSNVKKSTAKKLHIDEKIISRIREKCLPHRISLHSVLQFIWHHTLHSIGGGATTVVGTVVSGRNIPVDSIDTSVGLFINTLPLVVEHSGELSVLESMIRIQSLVNKMNSFSTIELGALQTDGMKRRLFDTLLVLENYPATAGEASDLDGAGLDVELVDEYDKVDYPLAVVARDAMGGLDINLWYAAEIFSDDAIDTLLDTVKTLFGQISDNLEENTKSLELLSHRAKAVLDHWNSTDEDFSQDLTLSRVFESTADRWATETAVVYKNSTFTYEQLNKLANQFSDYLLTNFEIGPDTKIALFMDKSEWLFVAILGVWKAGAAYVPIDTTYPSERIQFMLEDTDSKVIVTDPEQVDRLNQISDRTIVAARHLELETYSNHNNRLRARSTDLAYAIYTSGTTGKPKAVLVEHRGVVNLHASLERLFKLNRAKGQESILSFSNYIFDHFVEQMTDALLSGQKLVVLDDKMRTDHDRLYQYMSDNKVTYLSGTPSVLSLYEYSRVPSLTRIDAIGEDFTSPVFEKIRSTFSGMIINGYGPTEISITSHKRPYTSSENRINKSIGLPVANTKSYVLDSSMRQVPVGGIGELYIGGVGVTRGYLNRDELTQERFISNPFQKEHERDVGRNSRLYKTGDLVRWLPTGELEYLGRNDMQVKIRGLRVELGEIEAALSSFPQISRSFVIAREYEACSESASAQKYLVGFYLSDVELVENEIRDHLKGSLPEALVPAHLIHLDEIPVTPSGKLDIRKLPQTQLNAGIERDKVMPRGDIEKEICLIWAEALDLSTSMIGATDDFFRIGGDSLRAIKLVHLIKSKFNVTLSIQSVFENTTIKSQGKFVINHATGALAAGDYSPEEIVQKQIDNTRVSIAQERILFIEEFVGGHSAYNIPFVLRLAMNDSDSVCKIKNTVLSLIIRHNALRTIIVSKKCGKKEQVVLGTEELRAQFQISKTEVSSADRLDRLLALEAEWIFDLTREIPLKVNIFEFDNTLYLSLVFHHIAFDGWSWNIFQDELSLLLAGVNTANLATIRFDYNDFASWQRQRLIDDRLEMLQRFWINTLHGFRPLNLPVDKARPREFNYLGREIIFDLDAGTVDQLKAVAVNLDISFYSLMLGVYGLLLHVYTGQNDLVIGTPSANRWESSFDNTIGYFANLLVLRTELEKNQTLKTFFSAVGESVRTAQIHQELPFEHIVKCLEIERDASRHPIVQTIFSYISENVGASHSREFFEPYIPDNNGYTSAKFDLSFTIEESTNGTKGNFTYAISLFEESTILGMVKTFQNLVQEILRLSNDLEMSSIYDVHFVEDTERKSRTNESREVRIQADKTPIELFEYYARKYGDSKALVFNQKGYTYDELNQKANQLANHIARTFSLESNDVVALIMQKSDWTIISILAVWKLGAAYVPIDPEAPLKRISFMLNCSEAKLLLLDTPNETLSNVYETGYEHRYLCIDRIKLKDKEKHNQENLVTGKNLCYVIFTSGTTGQPKPVFVNHENVAYFISCINQRYFSDSTHNNESILFLANYVFDFSVEQIALSILSGNRLIIPESEDLYTNDFYRYANQHELSYLSGTPSQILQFDLSKLTHLRFVLVAGESFQLNQYEKIRTEYAGRVFNAYGTTETTVYNSVRQFNQDDVFANDIGYPLPNSDFYIANSSLRLLPDGARGELYISGKCVSKGYLKNPEISSRYFLPNPFQTPEQEKFGRNGVIYKTGDLVRRRPCGALEFLGRNDSQVKISGIRIEPAEIETAILEFPGISRCHVLARESEHQTMRKQLCAYYVAGNESQINEIDLISYLKTRLINSMIPSTFIRVADKLPVTANGKIDVDALKLIKNHQENQLKGPQQGPRTLAEYQLKQVWSQALKISNIAVDDNFFHLGGDSITALRLATQIRRRFNKNVNVKDLFDYPTITLFSRNVLDQLEPVTEQTLSPPLEGACPMLPIQKWFFEKDLPNPAHWNQYFAIKTPILDVDRLEKVLLKLMNRHDVFRLRYKLSTEVEQFYCKENGTIKLYQFDVQQLSPNELDEKLEHIQSNYDLENGPLQVAAYLHGFEDGSARVWMSFHHLIVDTVSWHNITQDLEVLYHGIELGTPSTSYKEWVESIENYQPLEQEPQYWAEIAEHVREKAHLLNRSTTDSYKWQFVVAEQDTRRLMNAGVYSADSQLIDLLLCALANALPSLTAQSTNYVTMEGHGREEFDKAPDVKDAVGWFTSMYPFRLTANNNIRSSIRNIKENRASIQHNGIGYGAILGVYGSESAPLPKISFNYLGRFEKISNETDYSSKSEMISWQLDTEFSGVSKGLNKSNANESVVDITVKYVGGSLVFDIDSLIGAQVTERFFMAFKSCIEKITGQMTPKLALPAMSKHDWDIFEPYIVLNKDVVGTTLFVLPPGEGGVESYLRNIARELKDIKLVLFNNIQLYKPMQSFGDIARYYLKFIREIQPVGPYNFLGWSFGGVLSLEMAKQLSLSNEFINQLILIDSFFDVKQASKAIGLANQEDILDPINYRYRPAINDLEILVNKTEKITLFKATEASNLDVPKEQQMLFSYFANSKFNNLDVLISPNCFDLIVLQDKTHFSWIQDETLVARLAEKVHSLMMTDSPSPGSANRD